MNVLMLKDIWHQVQGIAKQYKHKGVFSKRNIILNLVHAKPGNILNVLVLKVKQYLYRKRCKKELPNIEEIEYEMRELECIEKYNANISGRKEYHEAKWGYTQDSEPLNLEEYCQSYLLNR